MCEPINTKLHRPNVTTIKGFRRGIIATLLMIAAPIATLAQTDSSKTTPRVGVGGIVTTDPPKVAPSHPDHATPVNLAEKATDPTAILFQFQFQYFNIRTEGSDFLTSKIILQPILPISKTNVMRATLPMFSEEVGGDRIRGLGDLVVLDFFMFQTKNSSLATGPAASIPTATDDALGSGKLSIGPNFLWIYKGIKKTQWGILAEYLVSVAGEGDRDDVSVFLWQPIFTRHFKWGYITWSDQQWSFDFEHDLYSIPIGMSFGKVFMAKKTPWNISVEPYYVIEKDRENDIGLKFQWTLIVPDFKW
jgi:hypothetical protein